MAHDNMTFPEAVEMLARRAGVQIPTVERREDKGILELYKVNTWAADSYNKILLDNPEAAKARPYLEKRGFDTDAQARFKIGFAPNSRSTLTGIARAGGISADALVNAGLGRRGDRSGLYDYFSNRIIFPIRDMKGRTVGFGGRSLDGSEPKYINTAETPIFSKSRLLYGLDIARNPIRRAENAYLTEGYTDVLMAHLKGIDTAVAVLGTAVGPAHGQILRRYTPKVTMVFDADEAGRKALERSVEVFVAQDVEVYVVELPKGTDLCSFLLENGKDAFEEIASRAQDFVSYLLKDVSSADRVRSVDSLVKVVANAPDPKKRDHYISEISRATPFSMESLRAGLAANKVRAREGGSAAPELPTTPERYILQAIVSGKVSPDIILKQMDCIDDESIENSVEGKSLKRILTMIRKERRIPEPSRLLADETASDAKSLIVRLADASLDDYERQFRDSVNAVRERLRKRKVEFLQAGIRDARAGGNEERAFELIAEYNRLTIGAVSDKEGI